MSYSKTCVKGPLSKRQKNGFQYQLSLNAGQKYFRMLQGEHSAILSTFIKLLFVIKIFVLSILGWRFYTGLTVIEKVLLSTSKIFLNGFKAKNSEMHILIGVPCISNLLNLFPARCDFYLLHSCTKVIKPFTGSTQLSINYNSLENLKC